MISRTSLFAGIVAAATLFSVSAYSAWWSFSKDDDQVVSLPEATEIAWRDLIPDDFEPPENPYITMSQEEIDKLMDGSEESNAEVARITEELSYAPTVAELDGRRVKIPAYVTPLAMKFNGMYEPVWAIGTIRAEAVTSELAESGYRLDVEELLPYNQR